MPKYTVRTQPSGLLNGYPWPEAGESVDLPEGVADEMIAAGALEKKKTAKTAEKKVETATSSKAKTETRKKS